MPVDYSVVIQRAKQYAPYLDECLNQFPDIQKHFETGGMPDAILKTYQKNYLGEIQDLDTEMSRLRILKRAVHLICALSDLAQIWTWVEVTQTLSDLADVALQRLLRAAAVKAGIEGTDNNPVPGLFIIAMGKHGAGELNYSSDIDFTVFYDPEHIRLPNMDRAERDLIRLVRDLVKGLEQRTADGYIFRADLRLRPDPRSNAIVVSTHTAERYYASLGQNWERAALIKARVCAGDIEAGVQFKQYVLIPFIWRRSLDYAAIEDIQAIKRQIDARSGGDLSSVAGHHVKLGRGGIREIEFYAQVQQLILGGRHKGLREIRTIEALHALTQHGFVEAAISSQLTDHYKHLRDLEHTIQMVRDEQDHILPEDDEARRALAGLRGYETLSHFDDEAMACFTQVTDIYRALYPQAQSLASDEGNLVFTGVEPDPETLKTLNDMGFERANEVWRSMSEWLGGRILATRTVRARELLTRLAPELLKSCQNTGQPDHAFFAFSRFFTGLRTGVNTLSMFVQAPENLQKIISSMALSERVADQLAYDPSVMDAMVEPDYLNISTASFKTEIEALDLLSVDFETAINRVRVLVKELRFRLTFSALDGRLSAGCVMDMCSELADETISALLPVAVNETQRVFGEIKGDYAVVGLGKLGGREMRLTSDLDMMLLYEPHPDGELRADIYTKLTQRLISALSAVTGEGGLFEVDLTLRPSGRSGPVAVSLNAFETYYQAKAWTWEFMALTRARIITSSSRAFQHTLQQSLQEAMCCPRPDLDVKLDISEMLERTRAAKPAQSGWDIKNSVGGLRDIEYIAQTLWLSDCVGSCAAWPHSTDDMLKHHQGMLEGEDAKMLVALLNDYHALQQWQSLLGLSVETVAVQMDTMLKVHKGEESGVFEMNLEQLKKPQARVTQILSKLLTR